MTLAEVIDTLQTWIEKADDEYDREEMGRVAGLKEALHEIKKIVTCEDAISRQAVLEILNDADFLKLDDGAALQESVNQLPPVTPQPKTEHWIPVSERLPEVGNEVLVCYDFKGKRSVYIADFYGDGNFHGLDDEYLTTEGRKYRKAVAWMPLPEAYKASPTGEEVEEGMILNSILKRKRKTSHMK